MIPRRELGTAKLFAFALPAMPLAALYSPITVYLPPFYSTEMGLGLAGRRRGIHIRQGVGHRHRSGSGHPERPGRDSRQSQAALAGHLRSTAARDGSHGVHAPRRFQRYRIGRLSDVLAGSDVHRLYACHPVAVFLGFGIVRGLQRALPHHGLAGVLSPIRDAGRTEPARRHGVLPGQYVAWRQSSDDGSVYPGAVATDRSASRSPWCRNIRIVATSN